MADLWRAVAHGMPLQIDKLPHAAKQLLEAAAHRKVWIFYGDMGAGKTTLIKAICNQLGVSEGMSSPTFSIINEYRVQGSGIFHFDFYRIRNEVEAMDIGVEEYFDSGSYCFIEWPDKVQDLLPDHTFKIRILPAGDDCRKIEFMS